MSQARIDENDRPVLLAKNDTTGLVEEWHVDPILNCLEVFIVVDDGLTPTTLNTAKIDANDRETLLGLNETTGLPEAFRCDSNGVLKIIIV